MAPPAAHLRVLGGDAWRIPARRGGTARPSDHAS